MVVPTAHSDSQLVESLMDLSKKNPKLVRSSEYTAPADETMKVRSWKMNEFKYYQVPSPFPTLARGLFTQWIPASPENPGDGSGKYRIVARGYDKFFNIGEVPWTNWAAIEKHTSPPYDLTLKSNGCIIFIGAISSTKLVITSKHSLGPIQNVEVSHAQMGERWLHKHLGQKNKTAEQLAEVLWNNNWTAVAELCDDSFEEHVLAYSADKTGLHLHGINETTGAFATRSPKEVAAFAHEWGLIETPSHTVHTISEVKEFTDDVAKTGSWNGEPVEGFVVRCHIADTPQSEVKTAPPYPPRSSFFFKVKFDEPYMMYRDWREITKILLSAKDPENASLSKAKLNRPESRLYKDWVLAEIIKDQTQFEGYSKGRGIIATRERFLDWMKTGKGTEKIAQQDTVNRDTSEGVHEGKRFGKTLIVPVAIPGCGKTSIAVALQHLFEFGHTQNDDIRVKKAAPVFVQNVLKEFKTHDVVIADKNNHLRQHRQNLRDATQRMSPPVRLIAFNWALDKPPAIIHRICADRILDRGDNHQTLRADAVAKNHEEVLWMFINQTEDLAENEVDEIVEMDLEEDLERMLDRAVDACVRVLGVKKPSPEQVAEALAIARGYEVKASVKDEKQKKKTAPIRYFGFLPEMDVEQVIEARLSQKNVPDAVKELWEVLKKNDRVTKRPHITIAHSKNLPQDQDIWDRCQRLFLHTSPPSFTFKLGHLVYDDRVMALTVEDLNVASDPEQGANEEAREFLLELDDGTKKRLHITIGTQSGDISPIEGKILVESWRNQQAGKHVESIRLDDISVRGRVKGLVA